MCACARVRVSTRVRERERESGKETGGGVCTEERVRYRFDRERTRRGTIHHTQAQTITLECTKSPARVINKTMNNNKQQRKRTRESYRSTTTEV